MDTVLSEAEKDARESLQWTARITELKIEATRMTKAVGMHGAALCPGRRVRSVAMAKWLLGKVGVKKAGYLET